MDEYWNALIKGLTPDTQRDAHLFWIAPLIIGMTIFLLSVIT